MDDHSNVGHFLRVGVFLTGVVKEGLMEKSVILLMDVAGQLAYIETKQVVFENIQFLNRLLCKLCL